MLNMFLIILMKPVKQNVVSLISQRIFWCMYILFLSNTFITNTLFSFTYSTCAEIAVNSYSRKHSSQLLFCTTAWISVSIGDCVSSWASAAECLSSYSLSPIILWASDFTLTSYFGCELMLTLDMMKTEHKVLLFHKCSPDSIPVYNKELESFFYSLK